MKIWKVTTEDGMISFGNRKRKMLNRSGCNEPFCNVYWCPKRKWFQREPCPFINKLECDTYLRMCGSL